MIEVKVFRDPNPSGLEEKLNNWINNGQYLVNIISIQQSSCYHTTADVIVTTVTVLFQRAALPVTI